jgi:hypothetical protein
MEHNLKEFLMSSLTIAIISNAKNNHLVTKTNELINFLKKPVLLIHQTAGHSLEECYKDAINKVKSEYIVFVTPGQLLNRTFFDVILNEINYSKAKVIYSDEILPDSTNNLAHYYKTDFNRELLYCQNYLSRLAVYNVSHLKEINAMSGTLEGNVDWMLSLEATQNLMPSSIKHIPIILSTFHPADYNTNTLEYQRES